MSTDKRFSFPAVPISFILLLLVGAGIYWFLKRHDGDGGAIGNGGDIVVSRVPGGTLTTSGLTKSEQLSKSNTSDWWLGTTSSLISVDATYRYEVKLRSDWKFVFDEPRKVAFVVAPQLEPQLPVAINTETIQEKTSSGWARFDKWDHLAELRKELTPFLDKRAKSQAYIDLCRGEARKTVEEFVADWILKNKKPAWSSKDRPVVKVYFEDEKDIPFPTGKSLGDFLP